MSSCRATNGKHSRDKGKRGEREACEELAVAIPGLRRLYGQSRKEHSTPDIDGPGCQFFIEVKRQAKPNILGAYEQATKDANGTRPVLVVSKSDRGPWLVTMSAETLAKLIGEPMVASSTGE